MQRAKPNDSMKATQTQKCTQTNEALFQTINVIYGWSNKKKIKWDPKLSFNQNNRSKDQKITKQNFSRDVTDKNQKTWIPIRRLSEI